MKVLILSVLVAITTFQTHAQEKLAFWNQPRKGANGDGGAVQKSGATPQRWFKAAKAVGIEYVRLNVADWKGEGPNFLLGDANQFTQIPPKDLAYLKKVLDAAEANRVKVLLTMFQLPGAALRETKDGRKKRDYRLWTKEKYQQQALKFWRQLAQALKDHPAIVGYNPINEPHPGRQYGLYDQDMSKFEAWLKKVKNTTEDLNRFNKRIVQAIRAVDKQTPIVLNGWMHGDIKGLTYLTPVQDDKILYAFHYYGAWRYVTFRANKGQFSYPDKMPKGWGNKTEKWSKAHIAQQMQPVIDWAKRYKIPTNRMIAEEFGVDRRVGGAQQFLADIIQVLDQHQWHWAFYSFRSSTWDGMDYELGTKKLNWKYWQKLESGVARETLVEPMRKGYPIWMILKKGLLSGKK
ncbi:hypothetical protein BKI52_38820 [marine bacterium AO1-C]|nr:hypothetical protein BKI52_38820 [marine bacterium AO1-C]